MANGEMAPDVKKEADKYVEEGILKKFELVSTFAVEDVRAIGETIRVLRDQYGIIPFEGIDMKMGSYNLGAGAEYHPDTDILSLGDMETIVAVIRRGEAKYMRDAEARRKKENRR